MEELIATLVANKMAIWLAVSTTVTAAAAIAALTPSPKDDSALAKVRMVLDWIAGNVLNAKNAPKTETKE